MTYDAVIIGGGLAGLSAGVNLAIQGKSVLLLEQRQYLGGRSHSFIDEATGDVVDNGQHLMMGCYHETRRYLRTIGSEHLATLQPNLHIDFLRPYKDPAYLTCPSLPAPLHILDGLMGLDTLSYGDRLRLLFVGIALLRTTAEKERRIESMTVDEWLNSLHQSIEAKRHLWNILAIGSLNDDPTRASALPFFRVLRAAFLRSREDSSLLIPRVGLSELLVDPAVRYLGLCGGQIRTGQRIEKIVADGGKIEEIRTSSGEVVRARSYIAAVPYFDLFPLLEGHAGFAAPDQFESVPIITVNLWFDSSVMTTDFAALLDARFQWVFNKTRLHNISAGSVRKPQYLSLVMSAAGDFVNLEKDELIGIALEDLGRVLPGVSQAKLVHSLVVKEKRATFSPKPGMEAVRPHTETSLGNFFLAGDWTNTGLPATIEGAILSGRHAAEKVVGR